MLYIQHSLGPDEELVHIAYFHWMHEVNAVISILWGAAAAAMLLYGGRFAYELMGNFPPGLDIMVAVQYLPLSLKAIAFFFFVMGVFSCITALTEKATTEIAITSLRVIYKRGLLARNVGEISIDRIEGVVVIQSVLGRLLNYGRLSVRGMGVGEVLLPKIQDPIRFRQAIQEARAYHKKNDAAGQGG